MTAYWFQNRYIGEEVHTIPPAEAEARMSEMVRWERTKFAGNDLTLEEVGIMAAHFYQLNAQIMPIEEDPEVLKQQIVAGHPVIVPVMTQLLTGQKIHPAYTRYRGPHGGFGAYHLMVVIGYDSRLGVLYADDPGIVPQGRRVAYPWPLLSEAMNAQAVSPNTIVRQGRTLLVLTPH